MVILDTNIIIDHLRLQGKQPSRLELLVSQFPDEDFGLSIISVQELFEGQSTKDPQKLAQLSATIKPLNVLDYSVKIAKQAGEIARDLTAPISFADAAIAATALEHKCKFATLNTKHFAKIPGLILLK